jgi:hypothetical protein
MSYYEGLERSEITRQLVEMHEELDVIYEQQQELELQKLVIMEHRREAIKALGATTINNYWTNERPDVDNRVRQKRT